MTQKAIKIGDSVGVVIPKRSLKGLGIRAGDDLRVNIDYESKTMSVRPVAEASGRRERVTKLTLDFIDRYRDDLEALADK